jgi:hypothetical protein
MTVPLPTTDEPTAAGTLEGHRCVALLRAQVDIENDLPAKIAVAKAAMQPFLDHEEKVMRWCARYWRAVYAEIETYFASAAR